MYEGGGFKVELIGQKSGDGTEFLRIEDQAFEILSGMVMVDLKELSLRSHKRMIHTRDDLAEAGLIKAGKTAVVVDSGRAGKLWLRWANLALSRSVSHMYTWVHTGVGQTSADTSRVRPK
ncbi:uncharacterized protein PGTG_07737 [Puccinia graminis f. sp. tritici CRL 75-36-700-3]|uniref:Uncharacterized protein n=1 Tax=Puccinia graminis f. sp. tritici (strain CRL 75-36-700-3 / race SCCL) TaxID=418459 RepID=E3KBJ2_PUCGT|nr:uncharacterized protein PGTG_07737 [Puccinia graminis f. sp. tritici CRL 75-36-700-3]EFP81488.1 hypothetical protein PGTG_07737 [Puccinia graminis f. sp. tritici CRL 75-36-700-3]